MRRGAALATIVLAIAAAALLARLPDRPADGPADKPVARAAAEPLASVPVEEWTPRFRELEEREEWDTLDDQLDDLQEHRREDYDRYELGYLHARAALEAGRLDEAKERLEPYLREGHALRDLALHHRARIADRQNDEAAGTFREQLLLQYPGSPHRDVDLETHLASLEKRGDPAALRTFAAALTGQTKEVQRDIASRLVLLDAKSDAAGATTRGLELLRASTADDPADRVFRALDRPDIASRFTAEDKVLMGEAARGHRHYDRAVDYLKQALDALPAKREDLLFSIGRAHFGAERFPEAEQAYLQGAAAAKSKEQKAVFLYHASRCAQLVGNDTQAEAHLAKAIQIGAGTSRAATALTQRIRTRLAHRRDREAAADWSLLQKKYKKDRALYEAGLAYAVAMVARGNGNAARAALHAIPRRVIEKNDDPEIAYWIGRSHEATDPGHAIESYARVLLSTTPTHYDVFVHERLERDPRLRQAADARVSRLRARVNDALKAEKLDDARLAQTELALLVPRAQAAAELEKLADVYRQVPVYKDVLQLSRQPLPRLPVTVANEPGPDGLRSDRHDLLLALGLLDDATDLILERYGLSSAAAGLTRAQALSMAGATRSAIGTAESTMQRIPSEFQADLLPPALRRLLYPREYWDRIREEAKQQGADPRLVLSIMREESRFNPRAKSPAAARGLLQFIIGTARDVGRAVGLVDVQPEDLYDPEVIIRLGARYIGDLLKQFDGDPYRAAAAYNAGPVQTKLWSRLQAAPGRDYFLVAVNFDETKNYVRKVMNSYVRYGEIYGENLDRRVEDDAPQPARAD